MPLVLFQIQNLKTLPKFLINTLTIEAIRARLPECGIEVLTPDFQGSHAAMDIVLAASPDVLNHNTETVPRLYRQVRLGARYERSLDILAYAKQQRPEIPAKSGLMLGLGETMEEVHQVMRDLRASNVDILTLGQYLRPSLKHLPIIRHVTPDEFAELKRLGYEIGFKHVESGPLVRSSFHAADAVAPSNDGLQPLVLPERLNEGPASITGRTRDRGWK